MSELLLINPRRAKRRKSKSRTRVRRRAIASAPRRRRRKRARALVAHAPRRIRRRRLRNPSRRHIGRKRRAMGGYRIRRRRLRNPSVGGFRVGGMLKQTVIPAVTGGIGAIALDVAWGYGQQYLPASMQSGFVSTAVKIAAALGLGMVAGKVVGKQRAQTAVMGAVTVIAYQALRDVLKTSLPTVKGLGGYADYQDYSMGGMGAYMPPQLGFVSPAPILQGLNGGQVGAYMSPDLQGYNWQNDGM